MSIQNPVYYNAALSAFYRAAMPSSAFAVPNPTVTPPSTAAQLIAAIESFSPAAVAFATAVDAAVSSQSFSGANDPSVTSAPGVTRVASTAAQSNALSSRPLALGAFCASSLASVSANNGTQGGAGSSVGGLAPPPSHTPSAGDYTAIAAAIAAYFAAYISGTGGESTT